jgi:hypothetical protein
MIYDVLAAVSVALLSSVAWVSMSMCQSIRIVAGGHFISLHFTLSLVLFSTRHPTPPQHTTTPRNDTTPSSLHETIAETRGQRDTQNEASVFDVLAPTRCGEWLSERTASGHAALASPDGTLGSKELYGAHDNASDNRVSDSTVSDIVPDRVPCVVPGGGVSSKDTAAMRVRCGGCVCEDCMCKGYQCGYGLPVPLLECRLVCLSIYQHVLLCLEQFTCSM